MKESTRVREKLGGGYAGIHSVEVAAEIMLQLAKFRHPVPLKTLSDLCQLSPSKVHRYLSSLIKLGLIFQGQKSANYTLGRNAVTLGLAAMQQNDQIYEVIEELPNFVRKINRHVLLTVWSKAGPTIIKWERSSDPLVVGLPLGQVLPMTHSAAGLVFSAFLDSELTRELIDKEQLSYRDGDKMSEKDLQSILQAVRENRFAVSKGEVESDVTKIAMPVVDWEDNAVVVVGVVVPKHTDPHEISAILTELTKFCAQFSIHKPAFSYAK